MQHREVPSCSVKRPLDVSITLNSPCMAGHSHSNKKLEYWINTATTVSSAREVTFIDFVMSHRDVAFDRMTIMCCWSPANMRSLWFFFSESWTFYFCLRMAAMQQIRGVPPLWYPKTGRVDENPTNHRGWKTPSGQHHRRHHSASLRLSSVRCQVDGSASGRDAAASWRSRAAHRGTL